MLAHISNKLRKFNRILISWTFSFVETWYNMALLSKQKNTHVHAYMCTYVPMYHMFTHMPTHSQH